MNYGPGWLSTIKDCNVFIFLRRHAWIPQSLTQLLFLWTSLFTARSGQRSWVSAREVACVAKHTFVLCFPLWHAHSVSTFFIYTVAFLGFCCQLAHTFILFACTQLRTLSSSSSQGAGVLLKMGTCDPFMSPSSLVRLPWYDPLNQLQHPFLRAEPQTAPHHIPTSELKPGISHFESLWLI